MNKKGPTISFRLSAESTAWIDERARAVGKSRGECAAEIVEEARRSVLESGVMSSSMPELKERMSELECEARRIRADIRMATMVLLCDAGKAEPSEAEGFVKDHMPLE